MKKLKVVLLSEWLSNPYKQLLSEELEKKGVEIAESLWSNIFLFTVLRHWKPDVLHLHTLHPFLRGSSKLVKRLKLRFFILQLLFLKLIGTKVVWTVHEWNDKLGTKSGNLSEEHSSILGKYLDDFIVHCESTKSVIAHSFGVSGEDKVHVIYHGNYMNYYPNNICKEESREKLKISGHNFVFLVFGGLYPYKGVLEAIKAFREADLPDASLVIAGKPCSSKFLDTLKERAKSSPNIILAANRVPDDEVQIYMNACDCVVVPYKTFTTSGVAVLAMSFGRACIAPRTGFFEDVLDDASSFLYSDGYEESLSNAMKTAFLCRQNIISMGAINMKKATNWSWDYVAKETLKVYLNEEASKCLTL